MTILTATAPKGLRSDPFDADAPPFVAVLDDDGALLTGLTSRLYGVDRALLASPAGPDGPCEVAWTVDGCTLRAVATARAEGVSFVASLAAVERVVDGNVAIQRWDVSGPFPGLTSVGAGPTLDFAVRRVIKIDGDGAISADGTFRARLPVGTPVTISLTVRWPLISEAEEYPTHDGGRQLWRSIVPPDLPDDPVPLIVALHGGNNTADNVLGLSNPSIPGGLKAVTAMALGAVLIAPNANEAQHLTPNVGDVDLGDRLYQGVQKGYVFDAIEHAAMRWNIDRSRIYLCGISMGGHGSLVLASQHPDVFAAVVSVVPPCDMERLWRDVESVRPIIERAFGGTPDASPQQYFGGAAIHICDNLLHTKVVVRGATKDELVPSGAHAEPLGRKLQSLGIHADVSVNPDGHHVDYDTVEGAFARALPMLLRRPQVARDPDVIVYRTADPAVADGAWWLRIHELAGPGIGHVEARREAGRVIVWASNVARLSLDGARDVELHADCPCVIEA